jgi:hypothetical protein
MAQLALILKENKNGENGFKPISPNCGLGQQKVEPNMAIFDDPLYIKNGYQKLCAGQS